MKQTIWTHLQRTAAVVVMLAVLAPAAVAQTAPAGAPDPGLIIEALRVLQTNYVDQVDPTKVLNAATDALRKTLSAAGIAAALDAIPPGLSEAEARRIFIAQFAAAAAVAGTQLTATQLTYAAIRGMTESFNDSHVGFLTPDANRERLNRQRGQAGFTGAGLIIRALEGRIYVTSVIPGSPAEQAGVRDFDRILRIDNTSTEGMEISQVSSLIRGLTGTPVTLTLQRGGASSPVVVTITRAPIVIPSIFRAELLDGGIGYIRLYQFVERTGAEFRAAVTRLMERQMRALILDLRGNSGGYLNELNIVLNTILPAGVPVYTEMRRAVPARVVTTTGTPLLPPTMPITVLVDDGSASASELLSAAIQEHRRGQLVGGKTAGAVEASIMINLSDGSALSVTTFRLASGKGMRLEGTGVTPDLEAAMTAADFDAGTDRPLGTAIRLVRQILALPAR
ncbi:MAG TPA: S41 family peptidase [bacterium]|nr:S41 family peptidase [bacterium]